MGAAGLLLALVLWLAAPAGAQNVVLAPQQQAAFTQNDETQLEFRLSGPASFAGFQVQVQYDAAQLQPVQVAAGAKLGAMSVASNLEDLSQAASGTQTLSIVAAAPQDAAFAAGEAVFTVTFKAKFQYAASVPVRVAGVQLCSAALKTVGGVSGGGADYSQGKLQPAQGSALVRDEGLPGPGDGVSAYLTGISPALTMERVLAELQVGGAQVAITPSANKAASRQDYPATGDKLTFGGDSVLLVVRGDANGDGDIDISDMVAVQRHLLGLGSLSGANLQAACLQGNGQTDVDISDMVKIQRHLLGIETL